MRTTVTFEDDTAAAVERLRRERSIGVSEAVNELIRAGLVAPSGDRRHFAQRSRPMRARVDLTNIGEILELVDGPDHR